MPRWQPPAPKDRVYVVGDVHGCIEQLGALLRQIDDDIAAATDVACRIVFVGDYVDRGAASADVLRFVAQANRNHPDVVSALMGNHERMMLDFLENPTGRAKRWLHHGGLQTLTSFDVPNASTVDLTSSEELLALAADLRDAMGQALVDWVAGLATSWQSGTLWVVHAGADPAVAMDAQDDLALVWGAERFLKKQRRDGQWVAFGHQPFDAPFAEAGRIAVDTGAVYGGRLTAARVDPDGTCTFFSA